MTFTLFADVEDRLLWQELANEEAAIFPQLVDAKEASAILKNRGIHMPSGDLIMISTYSPGKLAPFYVTCGRKHLYCRLQIESWTPDPDLPTRKSGTGRPARAMSRAWGYEGYLP